MAQQWQGEQPGSYRYPIQTGIPPNFQQQSGFGLAPQPTGFPQHPPGGFQQPQQTGFQQSQQTGFQHPQQTGFLGSGLSYQPTGFQGGGSGFQHRPAPPPPVPQIPRQFQGQPQSQLQPLQANQGILGGGIQLQRSFLSPSPGPSLVTQQTGFPGGPGAGLVPQITGFIDPRLQMMGSTFMPANLSAPYAPSGVPQFAGAPQQQQGLSLQQSFQQHNQAQRGSVVPKVPWALSKAERKQYDQIFRAWDTQGTGFINGETALQVFGQSGLEKNDMARIWSLADQDDRGKLNLAEFHVAMGLIYRRLNGNDIPETLPPELVPPSSRDLDSSVDFVKGLLANDGHSRVTNGLDEPLSRLPTRSFNGSTADGANTRKDGTIYRHNEDEVSSYKSSNRHIDRRTVRTGNESPSADLNELRRQLENASKMLDKATAESASRTAEDDALEKEMEDLRYRVRRVQDDLDYLSRGPHSFSRDEERRKLERDLLHLMNQRLPELERRIEERDKRKARDREDWARARDRGNDRYSKFDDGYTSTRDRYRDESDRRGYNRGTFDWDDRRPRSRNYDDSREYERRERSRGRESPHGRDRERGSRADDREIRPRSPPIVAASPPPPPAAPTPQHPPPSVPTQSPASNLKSMTPEERAAFIKADAQRRVQERMRALGVASPSSTPAVDSSVEDRLASERKEAEEKAKKAEKEAEERERLRRERLESAKASKDIQDKVAVSPPSIPSAMKGKTPAPPPPRRGAAPRPPAPRGLSTAPAPSPPSVPSRASIVQQTDPEEEKLRAREQTLRKEREARETRLRELEKDEAEQRLAEEQYQARRQAFLEAKASASGSRAPAPLLPPSRSRAAPPPPATRKIGSAPNAPPAPPIAPPIASPVEVQAPPVKVQAPPSVEPAASPPPAPQLAVTSSPPPPPLAPSAPTPASPVIPLPAVTSSPASQVITNPFNKLMNQGTIASPAPAVNIGGNNPFFHPQALAVTPTPPPVKATYTTAPTESDEDWDDLQEKDQDESSDDEYNKSRATRDKLASKIFGGMMPSRGQSPAIQSPGTSSSPSPVAPGVPPIASTPPAPPVPPAPPAPPPPAAPVAPTVQASSTGPSLAQAPAVGDVPPAADSAGGRNALLSQIQIGTRLRKAATNDRSAAAVSGIVLGDQSNINLQHLQPARPSPPSLQSTLVPGPPAIESTDMSRNSSRQSVDWYANLAADGSAPPQLPTTLEEDEEPQPSTSVPDININPPAVAPVPGNPENPLHDVDMNTEYMVRSLYPYEGQRAEDLSFTENLVINAHPSKTGGDWWYGTLKDGKSGFFPSTYVQKLENVKAKAIYTYNGGNADELSFSEGDELTVVDRSEEDWWKTERDGVIFIVPATYLEVIGEEVSRNLSSDISAHRVQSSDSSLTLPPAAQELDSDAESSSEAWSSDDSNSELEGIDEGQSEEQRQSEHKARELERQRVLAAAGLIVKREGGSSPHIPVRPKSLRKRRPAPAAPDRSPSTHRISLNRDLPPLPADKPTAVAESILHVDDAFDRYETFIQQSNRASISSYDTGLSSPSGASTISPTTSKEENRGHGYTALLNFLGRRTPGTETDRRSNASGLNISGPIISGPISKSPSREGSPAFGSSWASLVDRTALEGIPQEERRRQEAIFELIATENAYVRDLQLIVETFVRSLMPMLDPKAITVIFANIEDILLTNTEFLSSLEERQKDCRLYIDSIGDLVQINVARMGVYMQYCVNTAAAIKILQSMRDSRPELAAHLQRLRDDPAVRNLDLSSYLLTPMQRITRYPLLIRQIISQTHHQPERQQLEKSVAEIEQMLDSINESIREQEGQDRLRQISQNLWIDHGRLDLTEPTRFMGPRKLLKEGPLAKSKSNRKLLGFLCSDILVLTEEAGRSLYRMPIPLSELQVREAPGGRHDLDFQIALAYPRGGSVINLRAASTRDAENWIRAIEHARARCIAAQKRATRSRTPQG